MSKKERITLVRAYQQYRTSKKKRDVLDFLRAHMAEIISRTTKLEEESVTRKMIAALVL